MVMGDYFKIGFFIVFVLGIFDYEGFEGREDVVGVFCVDVLL